MESMHCENSGCIFWKHFDCTSKRIHIGLDGMCLACKYPKEEQEFLEREAKRIAERNSKRYWI